MEDDRTSTTFVLVHWTKKVAWGCATLLICLAVVAPARADTIPIGFLAFDSAIPDDPTSTDYFPGVSTFFFSNWTGSSSLSPDFPLLTALTFDATLDWVLQGGQTETRNFTGVAPGDYLTDLFVNQPIVAVHFSATVATATGLLLEDGSTFFPTSWFLSASIDHGGAPLAFGDLAVYGLEGQVASSTTPVPEPATLTLLGIGAAMVYVRKRWRKARSQP